MQISVVLNDNKSIKQYSNVPFEGSQLATINDADAYSLAEYSDLMWVDDNGLVHADNLPTTKYQQSLNQVKASIDESQSKVDTAIQTMQDKIDQANQASDKLDAQVKGFNTMIGQTQLSFTKQILALQQAAKATAEPTK